MFRNYLLTAWRQLLRGKLYSLINIVGLATGIAVTILIGLWIWDECTYDQYHQHHRQLAQVFDSQTWNGQTNTDREVDIPLEDELKTRYPDDFKRIALVSPGENGHFLLVGDKKLAATGMYAQADFPEMLTLRMLFGSKDGLKDPSSVLLTASLARAIFGDNDPTGRLLSIDSAANVMKVAGVYEDLPKNTSFNFIKFLMPWSKHVANDFWVRESSTLWGRHAGRLIVELNSNSDAEQVTARIKDIPKRYVKQGNESIFLHPMDKWHLYNEFRDGKAVGGRIRFVWLFGTIGVFVLLLACINFINLSTARSEHRAKEVGIRKTSGSLRSQLIVQFLTESVVLAFLGMMLAILLVAISLPAFNALLANKELRLPFANAWFWILPASLTLFTGLVAGSYPAFYLSGFAPVKVLKGTARFSGAGRFASLPRKALVVFQFTVSIILIIGTIIVYRQIQYARNRPVGYDRERLVSIRTMYAGSMAEHYTAMRNDLLQTGAVENMASSNNSPTQMWNTETGYDWTGKPTGDNPRFFIVPVSYEYGKTLGWEMKEGRDFSVDFASDTSAIILNEAAVKLTGLKDPIGQIIKWHGVGSRIIGVVKDMVVESPYNSANPTIFFPSFWSGYIMIRIKPDLSMHIALGRISPVLKKYSPNLPLSYEFADEEYAAKFLAEERLGSLAAFFTVLAIFISCLGLFGLASFVAEQRTKEIGIRKVLGASILQLWMMLSKEFLLLVVLSFLIATPIAANYMDRWLQGYEYRTQIPWWIFAVAGLGAMVITLAVVSVQSIKAAIANPIESLRSE
jgi:putative ABC transport system permease protein